jgi:spore coat polysaccharide biosynthesis protein SpsF
MKAAAFIPVRLSSSRLPAKHFRRIGDRTLLEWIVWQLRRSSELEELVIAVPAETCNEPLREFCRRHGLRLFWYQGDPNHVTTRLRLAAESVGAEICVLVSGDCPLVYAPAVDELVRGFRTSGADRLQLASSVPGRVPALEGVVIARRQAWQRADELADTPELKEHQFPLLSLRPDLFRTATVELPPELCMPAHRTSVDTTADLDFLNAVWRELQQEGEPFLLPAVVRLLERRPELKEINAHVHQRGLRERSCRFVAVVDAGGGFGSGHLMRSRELCLQLVERLGWSGHFVVDDADAERILQESGFRVDWGAFGRPVRPAGDRQVTQLTTPPDCDLLLVDIFDQRGAAPGWRQGWGTTPGVVSIENAAAWASEADLILFPTPLRSPEEVRARLQSAGESEAALTAATGEPAEGAGRRAAPRILAGTEYLILRREIREAAREKPDRDLDLLVYLHDPRQRATLAAELAGLPGLRAQVPAAPVREFPSLLARAHVYLSGFGVSFWEALAVGTRPVCWPDTEAHRKDALRFYRWLGLPEPWLISAPGELAPLMEHVRGWKTLPRLEDGTARVVQELARLVASQGREG